MLVVADASPIILLSRVGRLDLLPALYGRVLVPQPVFLEVVRGGHHRPGSRDLDRASWMDVAEVDPNDPSLAGLRPDLDPGEASALALARARGAELVLMDDREGRRVAASLGLAVKGTLGILVAAKREGLLQEIRPLIVALAKKVPGFPRR